MNLDFDMTRPPSEGLKEFFAAAAAAGVIRADIARAWGLSNQRVCQLVERTGVKFPKRKGPDRILKDRDCKQCGKTFAPKSSLKFYCSPACGHASKQGGPFSRYETVELVCFNCGETFERTRYQDKISKIGGCKHTFCSRECFVAFRYGS